MAETTTTRERFSIDPAHAGIKVYPGDTGDTGEGSVTMDVWRDKYRWNEEEHPHDSMRRVVEGVYAKDPDKEAKWHALEAMQKLLWVPAGRIQAGAGTPNVVTLLNCFMCQDIEDSIEGIADALRDAMLTQQQGGGIGMNFSTLRPSGAHLRRTGAVASGPLPFMDMWNAMCATIMSAGSRRGAMMAVMHCEHPDLLEFIEAKETKGRLTNFNLSVLITDAFMGAVRNNEDWYLGFGTPRSDGKHLFVIERDDDEHQGPWYAYSKYPARSLWDMIIKHTYEWSEPGVVFIDRINNQNNLDYCETITGTNPCGEQPLPANGCCNLGAVNLARMVKKPFTPEADFDYQLLMDATRVGVRFLDNVIDVTLYPLDAQRDEEMSKRRIGLGITGLGNCLAQLGLRYVDHDAVEFTGLVMGVIRNTAFEASALLAQERGVFPIYDPAQWGANSPVVQSLHPEVQNLIINHGIRNGVVLTIAPTGTTSLYAGNVSSGLEPVFLHTAQRRVRQANGTTFKTYTVSDYGVRLYRSVMGFAEDDEIQLPPAMVTHEDLTVMDHVAMQAACQKHVDSSVSKTINCREDISLEDFAYVYQVAYDSGCKGCTTYRYSDTRESILSAPDTGDGPPPAPATPAERPEVLAGHTYKVRWPSVDENYYITINDVERKPFEVFIQSTSAKYTDWTTALGLMISAIMRQGIDVSFIPEELKKVISAEDSGYVEGKFYGSLVALIGHTIGKHLDRVAISSVDEVPSKGPENPLNIEIALTRVQGEICPNCNMPTLIAQESCKTCYNCGYSNC